MSWKKQCSSSMDPIVYIQKDWIETCRTKLFSPLILRARNITEPSSQCSFPLLFCLVRSLSVPMRQSHRQKAMEKINRKRLHHKFTSLQKKKRLKWNWVEDGKVEKKITRTETLNWEEKRREKTSKMIYNVFSCAVHSKLRSSVK